jgi:hypothetical protein
VTSPPGYARRAALLAAAALAVAALVRAGGADAAPIDALEDCAAHVSQDTKGVQAIERDCPGIEAVLGALDLDRALPLNWRAWLDRRQLQDLAVLARRYGSPAPEGPRIASLPAILKSLKHETPRASSWRDVFRAWLFSHPEWREWLDRLMSRLGASSAAWSLISYLIIAAIVIGGVAVLVSEIRAGGPLRKNQGRAGPAGAGVTGLAAQSREDRVPEGLAERVADLLRRLVGRLTATRRLSSERVLTHRQLVRRSRFDQESQRATFASVAGAAESILYGARTAPAAELDQVLKSGESLLNSLTDQTR